MSNAILIVLNLLYKIGAFRIFVLLCDAILVILVVIRQLKIMFSRKTVLALPASPLDRKMRKLATKILISVTVLLPPCMNCAIVRRTIEDTLTDKEKGNLQFLFGITLNTVHFNSFTNAVLFLTNNVKSKQYLRSILKGTAVTRGNPGSTVSTQTASLYMETQSQILQQDNQH